MSLKPSSRTEVRRSRYKVAVDADEGRRRREDNMVEIRKNKREESLLKKRREGLQPQQFQPAVHAPQLDKKLESLPSMVAGVWSNDGVKQLDATIQLRRLLSIERNPPIEEVIQSGVVSRFVEFLGRDDYPQVQFEAAWALTNIASGTSENTKVVIDHGAVPIFVRLLSSLCDDVREQAVWALGNIAGDSPKCRDLVLSHGALMPLLAQFNDRAKLSMFRNTTWTLSNFCRGKPQPQFEQVKPALAAVAHLIHYNDEEVLTDACWALSYLSDGINMIKFNLHPSPSVLIPALRTVGNIVTGDDIQTQAIIDNKALNCLLNLLTQNHKKSIKKEACWTISNMTAGNKEQIQAVIEAGIISPLVLLLQNAEFEIKKEAAWAISNATSGGTHDQIKFLVQEGCIKPLCDLLVCPDPRIITVCLEGLENILKVGEAEKNQGYTGDVNVFAQMIDDAEGLEKIENLQSHDNNDIYEKAVKILETYWLEEDDNEQQALGSVDAQQLGFNFGGGEVPVPSGGEINLKYLERFRDRKRDHRTKRNIVLNDMDLEVEKKQDYEEKKNNSPSPKTCSRCNTTKTPLWRGGPDGPKSLCNACGIKYNKKRRQLLGLAIPKPNKKNKTRDVTRSNEVREILKMRFMALGNDMMLQRSRKLMSKLREEEQAALLLMALSCGSIYA
ncbi:importin subunit alpha [Phtheirospermum japonicum]|uniref:Importin subunit alpha n=1 Tax=Phtheirospermum japonicum TaxID=374723 RepID=A0A830B1T6_9LAMI|nr:importin subunit alpha [Phtheirospermum japonicum]